MIRYRKIDEAFASLPFPIKEYEYESNEEILLPYACYIISSIEPVYGDGITMFNTLTINLLYITDVLDLEEQKAIELCMTDNGLAYEKTIDFDEEERVYTVVYTFTAIE